MNKRIRVKKNYFAFLFDISKLWKVKGVRYSAFFVIGVGTIGLTWLLMSQIDMDASTLFGVFVLVAIPCAILVTLSLGFEKMTGFSCLQGIEWVGKQTLILFDKGMRQIKHWLGIEMPSDSAAVTRPIIKATQVVKPSDEHKANTSHIKKEPEFSEFRGASSDRLGRAEEMLEVDKLGSSDKEEGNITEGEDSSDLPLLSTESLETLLDESSFINAENQLFDVGKAAELQEAKEAKEAKEKNIFSEQSHDPLSQDQTLSQGRRAGDRVEESMTITPPENKIDEIFSSIKETNVESLFTLLSEKESLSELPFKEKGAVVDLEAFAKKKTADKEEQKVSLSDMGNDTERGAPEKTSMLAQAEETAATVLSSISQKINKPIKPLSELFSPSQRQYRLPSIDLLQMKVKSVNAYTQDQLENMSRTVERVLKDYKVVAEVVGAEPGPVITRFELLLAPGVKVSRVSGLAKDLARELLVTSVRIVEIIEGTPYIGLEIPNNERELVSFREIIVSKQFQQAISPVTLALGKDVAGQTVVSDLAKMPHLLVAGTTGSGKSVAINTMILSMLYKATPDQVRMIMIDPKMLELSVYEGIPHLLTPVVTDMKEAQNSLRWAVAEMDRRYTLLSKVKVRNLEGFNQKIREAEARGETILDPLFQPAKPLEEGELWPVLSTLPSIVIIIDELADMMMIVGKKVEELIARLAQKARAAGIHLILATQRPSVDVLTGLIKANVPTRISFQVSSRIDSRTILDQGGAESLLGNGDMLFLPSGRSTPIRSHGAFVSDDEVHTIVDYLKSLGGASYVTEIIQGNGREQTRIFDKPKEENDPLYTEAVQFVLDTGRASISIVQRRFKVGYNRAARMIDKMEEEKIVSEPEGNGSRRVIKNNE